MSHSQAIFHVLVSTGIFLLTPLLLAYGRLFPASRSAILLAILAVYALVGPWLPEVLPLWTIWLAGMTAVFCVRHYREGKREPFLDSLRFWPVPLILLLGFGLFLCRWDPPGVESAIFGATARRLAEGQPFTIGTEGGAVSLLIAMGHLGHWAPVERLVGFFTAVGAVLFVFCLASALGLWFERTAAFVGGLLAMAIFSAPQALLTSGAAPLFFGLTSGLVLLEFSKIVLLRSATGWETILYALAMSFGAYCDPTAFLVSQIVCFPALVWACRVCDSQRRFLRNIAAASALAAVFVFPALWFGRFADPPVLSGGGWPLALAVAIALGFISYYVDRRAKYRVSSALCFMTAATLASLGWYGQVPVSVQRAAEAMAVFPLAMPAAWLVEAFIAEWRKPARYAQMACFCVFFGLTLYQFRTHLGPEFAAPQLSPKDRAAMAYVQSYVPAGDCVLIDPKFAGRWIPTLTNRCVVTERGKARWWYLADGEPRPPLLEEDPVYDGGALVFRGEDDSQ